MSYAEYEHRDSLVLNVANQPVVTDPVAPQATSIPMQGLPELARTLRRLQSLAQKLDNRFLGYAVKLLDLFFGCAGDFNLPALSL